MAKIFAAKQVGRLSYFVGNLSTFYTVITTQKIKQSNKAEYNPRTKKKENYVSLSRSISAAPSRNNTRWRYGITIDGDHLSDRYHIEPFSFMGSALNRGAKIGIKDMTLYDDGSCRLRLVNWPAMSISRNTFDYIENLILSQPEKFNSEHKLQIQDGGKRRVNGHLIEKKYNYNVQHGDGSVLLSHVDKIPDEITTMLTKGENTNEYEERVWTSSNFLDISGCITGVIVPKSEIPDFETSDNKIITLIRDFLDEKYGDYKITYY